MHAADYGVNCIYGVKKSRPLIALYCILNALLPVQTVYCLEWFLKLSEPVNVVFDTD